MERVLVTGASGFVGRALVARLAGEPGWRPRAAYRRPGPAPDGIECCQSGDLGPDTDWSEALAGCGVVVHCAARVHVMRDTADDPLAAFRRANVEGAVRIARDAVRAGCRRFVFISSVKVNGESSPAGRPMKEGDVPAPADPYAQSKWEAEQALFALASETGLEVVVVRPPLVYGPGAKANFRAMMRLLRTGLPLPFGAIDNQRSLVGLDNLVDLIVCCLQHPAAAGQVFFAGDGEDMSTADLVRRIASALGVPSRLIPVPCGCLAVMARLLGRGGLATRLCGNLQVDIGKARARLGWRPPVGVDEGLRRAAAQFLSEQRRRD